MKAISKLTEVDSKVFAEMQVADLEESILSNPSIVLSPGYGHLIALDWM